MNAKLQVTKSFRKEKAEEEEEEEEAKLLG